MSIAQEPEEYQRLRRCPSSRFLRKNNGCCVCSLPGKTYAEMAQTLVVFPNTVKTQVSSIYRKPGVSRRELAPFS